MKSNLEIAVEVIEGKWGTGLQRQQMLNKAGYNYTEVQKLVNDIIKNSEKIVSAFSGNLKKVEIDLNKVSGVCLIFKK